MILSVLVEQHLIGKANHFGAHSPEKENLVVMFEDNGETGYFYAMDLNHLEQPVVDSLYVYGVDAIENREQPRQFQLCWDETGTMGFLVINGYPHAVFDFERLIGYNHSKFPMPEITSFWSHQEIDDKLVGKWLG